jgi:hypothetical protein
MTKRKQHKPEFKARVALGSVLNRDSLGDIIVIQVSNEGGFDGKACVLAERCGMTAD